MPHRDCDSMLATAHMTRGGVSSSPDASGCPGCVGAPGRAPAEMCGGAAWPASVLLVLVGGSLAHWHRTTNCNAKGEKGVTARNYIQGKTILQKSVQCFSGPPACRLRLGLTRPGSDTVARWPDASRRPVP